MKKSLKVFKFSLLTALVLGTVIPGTTASASESNNEGQTPLWVIENETNPAYDIKQPLIDTLSENVVIEYTDEGAIVTVYEDNGHNSKSNSISLASTAVYSWGAWEYTGIAVSTGVLAGAVNTALYSGIGVVAATVGLPAAAVGGLLTASSWTKLGGAPGVAVANNWDKNGNGWVGFYKSTGYDGARRAVATR